MSEFEYEPDSPECAGVDNLARALVKGKVPEVVQALRALDALDASASKSAVALLADFLDDKTNLGGLFPFRLKFASRGKPGHWGIVCGKVLIGSQLCALLNVNLSIQRRSIRRLKQWPSALNAARAPSMRL